MLEHLHHIALPVPAILPRAKPDGFEDSFVVPITECVGVAIQQLTGLLKGQNA